MSPLHQLVAEPELSEPLLICALDGWVDAGMAAVSAMTYLLGNGETTLVARFDSDALLDFRSRRPVAHLVDGVNTGLTWPSIELRHGHDLDGRDLLLLTGSEPDSNWQSFSNEVVDLAKQFGVRLVVGLGAFPAPAPHTRPPKVACTANRTELADHFMGMRPTLDVPAGVQAAIERSCADASLDAIGLWAQVPHYASAMAYPQAGAALLDSLAEVTGLRLDTSELREAGEALTSQLNMSIANNDEHLQMLHNLEAAYDAQTDTTQRLGLGPMPSQEELAAEVESFLREVNRSDGGETP